MNTADHTDILAKLLEAGTTTVFATAVWWEVRTLAASLGVLAEKVGVLVDRARVSV